MNQEKIGKYIAHLRKSKNLTQKDLGEILGVNDRTISRWENGNYMPDISMLKLLAEALDTSIIELLNGERIEEKLTTDSSDEYIVQSIDIFDKQNRNKNKKLGNLLISVGIIFLGLFFLSKITYWKVVYSILSLIFLAFGITIRKNCSFKKKIIVFVISIFLGFMTFSIVDFIGIKFFDKEPIYSINIETVENNVLYDMLTYKVYYCNNGLYTNKKIVSHNTKFSCSEIDEIDYLVKFNNKYIGNGANTSGLLRSLRLSEYLDNGIEIIDNSVLLKYYHSEEYISEEHNDELYVKRSIIYNTIMSFTLIDNLDSITFEFYSYDNLSTKYTVKRNVVVDKYPNFTQFKYNGNVDKLLLKEFINMISNDDFVNILYEKIF